MLAPKVQKLTSTAVNSATSELPKKRSRSFGKVFGVDIRSAQLPTSIRITGKRIVNSVMPKLGNSRFGALLAAPFFASLPLPPRGS